MMVATNNRKPVYINADVKRSMAAVVHNMMKRADMCLMYQRRKKLLLGIQAGCFVSFAGCLSAFLSTGVSARGPRNVLTGLGFLAGLFMIVLSGSMLFSELNVVLPVTFVSPTAHRLRLTLELWVLVFFANMAGAVLTGLMMRGADVFPLPEQERIWEMMEGKLLQQPNGALGWFKVLLSGIMGNWLIGMAISFAAAAVTIPGKLFAAALPVLMFVTLGVQHCAANMGLFLVGLQNTYRVEESVKAASVVDINLINVIAYNIIPAGLGNMVGAGVMCALLLHFLHIEGQQLEFTEVWLPRQKQEVEVSVVNGTKKG